MQVKDLIHLLQTRAKPDDDIYFDAYVRTGKESVIQLSGCAYDADFNTVWRESDYELCKIDIGKELVRSIGIALRDKDITVEDLLRD